MTTILYIATILATSAMSPMPTVENLQTDFETAMPCAHQVNGRNVWRGTSAFYIESYAFLEDSMDQTDIVGADAILRSDNSEETIRAFETACAIH
jgi:hypothetical protein